MMTGDRKSFLVYCDMLETCEGWSEGQFGKLYIAQLRYANGLDVEITDPEIKGVWRTVKRQMDRDDEKYKERCKKNKENWKKAIERKAAKLLDERQRTSTNVSDNDNGNGTGTETVTVNANATDTGKDNGSIDTAVYTNVYTSVSKEENKEIYNNIIPPTPLKGKQSKSAARESIDEKFEKNMNATEETVREKLSEFFEFIESDIHRPLSMSRRNGIVQELITLTDNIIDPQSKVTKQLNLLDTAIRKGWHSVYDSGEPRAGNGRPKGDMSQEEYMRMWEAL